MSTTTDSLHSTSSSLLQRAQDNDELAWERLCRLFGPTVYRFARRLGLPSEDAADIVQDVFAVVAGSLVSFDRSAPNSTFRGWLYVITRNKVRDRARFLSRRPETVPATDVRLDLTQQAENLADDDDSGDSTETRRVVQRALELIQVEFERSTWRAFQRTAVEGASPADVARELEMTVGAVYKAKSRVLQRLRSELDGLL